MIRVAGGAEETRRSILSNELNLDCVEELQRKWAIESFNSGDMEGFTFAAYSMGGTLDIVVDNLERLQKRGLYETALVSGYIGCKFNFSHWTAEALDYLFRLADRDKLRSLSDSSAWYRPICTLSWGER